MMWSSSGARIKELNFTGLSYRGEQNQSCFCFLLNAWVLVLSIKWRIFGGGGRIFLVAEKTRVEVSQKVLFAKWNDIKAFTFKVFLLFLFFYLIWFRLLER